MVEIKFKRLFKDAKLPTKGSDKAACFDFYVHRIVQDNRYNAILYLGLACEFPDKYVLTLQPRSSFNFKGWEVSNSPGQIDADYRGELQVRMQAIPNGISISDEGFGIYHGELEYPEIPFKVGDRCCQGKLEEVIPVEIVEVEELSETNRGEGGFGSTGK